MFYSVLLQGITTAAGTVQATADTIQQAGAQAATQQKEASLSLLDLIIKGGWIMIPIGILSILTIYFFFERFMVISKAGRLDKNFMNNIRDYIQNGNIESAKSLCKSTDAPAARMVEKGISRIGKPIKEIDEAMASTGKLEINRLEKNLSVLSLIGRIAPIFGFVGTIAGVIKIFYDISLTDNISIGVISAGLYQKMITSASGLVIGLMAFIAYYILNAMLDRTINKMETVSVEFMDLLHSPTR
jgi:biopolymer transport protein ExbB